MADYLELFIKDPDEEKEYGIDWSEALDGDEIDTSTWEAPTPSTSPALDYKTGSQTDSKTQSKIIIKGGKASEEYICANQITTLDSGETWEESIKIVVRDK